MPKKYLLDWPEGTDDLQIEMSMIRKGGQWTGKNGTVYGKGLSFHYEQMRHLLWPHLDVHRWEELCRDEILKNKITVLMGPKSSGKTHSGSWVYLCEYLCFPEETCVLVSSTDFRGLELRVWGEIKSLFQLAKNRFPYLPGYLIDSKHAIATDDLFDEDAVRDLRKGMMGIPCVQNGKFVGLGKYCPVSGTLIDTPSGPVPIETIVPGQVVYSAIGESVVTATSSRTVPEVVRIELSDGSHIDCSPEHPFLTSVGWVECSCLTPQHTLISRHETLPILQDPHAELTCESQILLRGLRNGFLFQKLQGVWEGVCSKRHESNFLYTLLRCDLENEAANNRGENDRWEESGSSWREHKSGYHGESERAQTQEPTSEEKFRHMPQSLARIPYAPNKSGGGDLRQIPGKPMGILCKNRKQVRGGASDILQVGHSLAGFEIGRRDRWRQSFNSHSKGQGCSPDQVSPRLRVVSVTVLKSGCEISPELDRGGYQVHNLQVEGHPSYSINGLIVHNCGIKQKRMRLIADEAALMASSFLSAFANLDGNEDFRAVILGNPQDTMDPLGRAAEPRDGWSSHLEPKKTEVWDTKFMGGRCVNLIGTDSPNFDFPASEPTRYKYLISREKIANTLSFFPKDSAEYYTQCIGSMKVGLLSRRVITREMCVQFKAMEPVMWAGTGLTKIGGLDSAYGGDRCIGGHIEFGQAVGGKITINVFPPVNVPVRVSADVSPEEQISIWVRDYCEANFIPPENFFHDSTGRGTLGTTLARVWSAMCNPVEFGGSATARPVALDFYVIDPKTHKRRLKLCNEHYSKFVTELWFAVSYAIQAGQVRGMTDEVVDEGCLRQWDKVAGDRISVETKQDMKERVGRSPDIFDWLAICVEGARRRGFNIQKMSSESEADGTDRSWWDAAASKANASKRGRVLALTQ